MPTTPIFPGLSIGKGCDSTISKTYGWALDFEPAQPLLNATGQHTRLDLITIDTSQELAENLNVSAAASFAGFGFNVSAEAKYVSKLNVNSFNTYLLASVTVRNPEMVISRPRLTAEAKTLLQERGWAEFEKAYGSEYMSGVITGGSYYGLLQIKTTSRVEQQEIKVKISGGGWGVEIEGEVEHTLRDITRGRETRVTVLQSGGSGNIIETTLDGMIEQASNFTKVAKDHPVPLLGIVEDYRSTVPLPLMPDGPILGQVRLDVLEELGRKYLWYKDYRSNLDYVLNHMLDFKEYQSLNARQLEVKKQKLRKDFEGVTNQLDTIIKQARRCHESLTNCQLLAGYYQPLETLPRIEGQNMMLKTLEEKVGQLTQRLEDIKSGIENGSIVAQKAKMLQARDANHLMRFRRVDEANRDVFEMWRSDDTWHQTIQVQSASELRYSDEFHWRQGEPWVKMWHSSKSIAFLTYVCGKFEGGGELVHVLINEDGYWYLGGTSQQEGVEAKARCFGRP